MAGKNKVRRWMRALVGGYDLSGDSRTFQSLDNKVDFVDLTGWNQSVHSGLSDGQREIGVKGFQALLNDSASRAFAVLKDAAQNYPVSVLFGGGAEPALGDPAYLIAAVQALSTVGLDGKAPVIQADFLPDAPHYVDGAVDNPLGVVLAGAVSLSATTTGVSIDQGAASTAGAHANLHVLASSGGTWALIIEHSTDDSSWSTLMTFSSTGAAVGAEQQTVTGTVNRYVRYKATRTSGTLTPVITFARN